MTIFVKIFMSPNCFLLITHPFKTNQTSSPVATPTKSTMPRRSKGSKHDLKVLTFCRTRLFWGHYLLFVRSRLFFFCFVSDFEYMFGKFRFVVRTRFVSDPTFCFGLDFFVVSDLFQSATFSSLVLKVSSLKTLTGERGLENPIQRTTFYLQRRSGARVMTCSVCLWDADVLSVSDRERLKTAPVSQRTASHNSDS